MSEFTPWSKYPSLTRDRLSVLATLIRRVRSETVALHQPLDGDSEWSLGCRVYSRTCYAIGQATKSYTWLRVLAESDNLQFSFSIGEHTFRFYRGKPDDPPERYLIKTFGEVHHIQQRLQIDGLPPIDKILRLAVEVNSVREVSQVTFVETDEDGTVTEKYIIPFDAEPGVVTSLETKPIALPPVILEPLQAQEEQREKTEKAKRERRKRNTK